MTLKMCDRAVVLLRLCTSAGDELYLLKVLSPPANHF